LTPAGAYDIFTNVAAGLAGKTTNKYRLTGQAAKCYDIKVADAPNQ